MRKTLSERPDWLFFLFRQLKRRLAETEMQNEECVCARPGFLQR